MAVTAQMVKELRETTSAGMMDCKKALVETDGDMKAAIDLLKEKGLAKAAKKASRIAAEGLVTIASNPESTKSALVEINSETDFVAKNQEFKDFVKAIGELALNSDATTVDELLEANFENQGSLQSVLNEKIATIGENMNIRRMVKIEDKNSINVGYVHAGGRIGAVSTFETTATYDEIEEMGKNISMQIAAMNPKYLFEEQVDADYIENEKKILTQQALNEGKPENLVEKMVAGRLKKEIKEICLFEQVFVKDSNFTVETYIEDCSKTLGKPIKITKFYRYEVGEGIEKATENFAEEVAKQING